MQDHFLFDDDDPKQRGKGCDALCANDPRLKFKWVWPQSFRWLGGDQYAKKPDKIPQPGQLSETALENGWCLRAVFWHSDYEAEVERHGNNVESYHVGHDKATKGRPALLTRLDAQLKAEELFMELGVEKMAVFYL